MSEKKIFLNSSQIEIFLKILLRKSVVVIRYTQVRYCCENVPTTAAPTTILDQGDCPATATWSAWRNNDGPAGYADYEGFARHTYMRLDYFNSYPSIVDNQRLDCEVLHAVQAMPVNGPYAGQMETDQIVRFGVNETYFDFPTTLTNIGGSYWNVNLGDEWKDYDRGSIFTIKFSLREIILR